MEEHQTQEHHDGNILPTCHNPFWEVGPTWVDGERGRTLRRLWDPNDYGETIAADLMAVVSALKEFLRGRRLLLTGGTHPVFQSLVDYVSVRLEDPYGIVEWTKRPALLKGWSEEDERIWIEWLDRAILTPENWNRHVMEPVFGRRGERVWEEAAGQWRSEWRAYAMQFVSRSRDILQEIDPRPWEDSADWGVSTAVAGEEEWRR